MSAITAFTIVACVVFVANIFLLLALRAARHHRALDDLRIREIEREAKAFENAYNAQIKETRRYSAALIEAQDTISRMDQRGRRRRQNREQFFDKKPLEEAIRRHTASATQGRQRATVTPIASASYRRSSSEPTPTQYPYGTDSLGSGRDYMSSRSDDGDTRPAVFQSGGGGDFGGGGSTGSWSSDSSCSSSDSSSSSSDSCSSSGSTD